MYQCYYFNNSNFSLATFKSSSHFQLEKLKVFRGS